MSFGKTIVLVSTQPFYVPADASASVSVQALDAAVRYAATQSGAATGSILAAGSSITLTAGAWLFAAAPTRALIEDARTTSSNTAPSGNAGGVLAGTYPNPSFAVDMATQAELDAVAATIATDAELAAAVAAAQLLTLNAHSGSYTLVLGDAGSVIKMAGAGTVTVPPNSSVAFPTGTVVTVTRYAAGAVAVAAGVGVTINSAASALTVAGQYMSVTLLKVATNEWLLEGALA